MYSMNMQAVNKNHSLCPFLSIASFFAIVLLERGIVPRCLQLQQGKICGIFGVYGPVHSGPRGAGHGVIMRGVWKLIRGSQRRK
jgi:hypothetical protein